MQAPTISPDIQCLVEYMPVDSLLLANATPVDRVLDDVRRNVRILAQFAASVDLSDIDDAKVRQDAVEAIREVRRTVEQLTPQLTGLMIVAEAANHSCLSRCCELYGALVSSAAALMEVTHPRLTFILEPARLG